MPTCTRALDRTGCSGTIDAPADSGHEKSANIALVLIANYTDTGGAPGSEPLTGASTRRLTPKTIQAEHYTDHIGTQTNTVANAEGGRTVGYADTGEYIYFEPVSLANIDQLTIRYAAGFDGGIVDVRQDAPDGPVVGTATLMPTASWTDFQNVTIPIDADDRSGRLYFTFRGRPGENPNDLFDLDEFTFIGKGVASNSAPTASAQADKVAGPAPLAVSFTGTGSGCRRRHAVVRVGLHERRHGRRDHREREPHVRGAGRVHRRVHGQRRRALAQRARSTSTSTRRWRPARATTSSTGRRSTRRAGAWCAATTSSCRSRAAR